MSYFNDPLQLISSDEKDPRYFVIEGIQDMCGEMREKNRLPHLHNYYSIFWIREGEAIHATRFVEHTVTANSLLFVPPGLVHRMILDEKCDGFSIYFNDNFFNFREDEKAELSNSPLFNNPDFRSLIKISVEYDLQFEYITSLMMSEFRNDIEKFKDEAIFNLIKLFLLIAKRLYEKQYPDTDYNFVEKDNLIIVRFKNLIENNYKTDKSVSSYANLLNITPVYLNELSRKITGITAGEHIRNRITRETKKMLFASDKSAKEIAYELGFEDPAYFSRFFKKHTSLTLTDFRRLYRKKSK